MDMLTGDDIKAIRESLGETMEQFADRLGVSPAAVCRWEQGNRHPHYKKMVELNKLRDSANGKKGELAKS